MKFIADFHIHSKFSIATSRMLVPEVLELWGKKKGIALLGTGDAVHPGWMSELKEKLTETGSGLLTLKKSYRHSAVNELENGIEVHFILTAEISCIYKKGGKVRKVHNLIVAPSFSAFDTISKRLGKIGNIVSDGRPILGIDSKDLLEIVLNSCPEAFIIPAHIWTPWFSVLGSKSGFDSIDECYDDLSKYIFAVETGLSSDPPMNWQCSFLDRFSLVSNSDAHSPENLGREANIFDTDLSYGAVVKALKREAEGFLGTIEYFPEEGKYHFDGHRKCGICWEPNVTKSHNGICSVCGKKVTVGVYNRVWELSDRFVNGREKNRNIFYSLTPLKNILSEVYKVGAASRRIGFEYEKLIRAAGSEFAVLIDKPVDELKQINSDLGTGIERLRARRVWLTAGYDGIFGSVKVL